jgi:hypothetical protein
MAERKREPQRARDIDPATQNDVDPATQKVVDLLTSILTKVQTQVRSETPKPLEGDAAAAVELFLEIGSTLALLPSITLTADPLIVSATSKPPFTSTLTWSSTEAGTVSIEKVVGNSTVPIVTEPAAAGSIAVRVEQTTTFRALATARGPCGGATTSVEVVVVGTP